MYNITPNCVVTVSTTSFSQTQNPMVYNHYSQVVTVLTFLVTLCNSALCTYSAFRWFRFILTPVTGYFRQQHEPVGVYNEDAVFSVR
jgi:hypothetical protein